MGGYYQKHRKLAFMDSSVPLPVDTEGMTGEEVAAPGPFNNAVQTAQERLYISRHGVEDRPYLTPRTLSATHYDPKRAPCNERAAMKQGTRFRPAEQHPVREFALTEYQRKLQYAEAPNIYLADNDPEVHYTQQG